MNLLKSIAIVVLPALAVFWVSRQNAFLGLALALIFLIVFAWIMRADVYTLIAKNRFRKNHQAGFAWFERAMRTGKMRPESQLIYAYLLLRDAEIEKAERLISKVTFLAKDKLNSTMMCSTKLNMALIKWKKGNLPEAIADMESLYNDDGFRSTVHYGTLGYFYILNGQYARALEFNTEAVEYNDTDLVIRDNLAQTHLMQGNLNTAKSLYEELLAQSPAFIDPYYNYGLTLEKLGDFEGALTYYEKALTYEEKYLSEVTHELVMHHLSGVEARLTAEKKA